MLGKLQWGSRLFACYSPLSVNNNSYSHLNAGGLGGWKASVVEQFKGPIWLKNDMNDDGKKLESVVIIATHFLHLRQRRRRSLEVDDDSSIDFLIFSML